MRINQYEILSQPKWTPAKALTLAATVFVITSGCQGGNKSAADAIEDLPSTCTGACKEMHLTAVFGTTTEMFDRAFFGLSSPNNSDSGKWEVYIENGAGDDAQCPTDTSPIPRFLLIIAAIPLPSEARDTPATVANLVDFEGALLPQSPREEASALSLSWSAFDACVACAEGSEADRANRMVALDIEASFANGKISGHSFATHCDSLDKL